jgi:hypothetical protein
VRSTWSRRALLGGFGSLCLGGLAGCTGRSGSRRGATDVYVHNAGDVPRTVDLTVTRRGSDSPRIDTRLELGPNEREIINNEVVMGSDYDVEVSFTEADGGGSYSETQEWNDAGRPLHVMLTEQIVFAVQIG